MSEKKVCVNCPGATDHSTAECPMRAPSVTSMRGYDFVDASPTPFGEVEAVEVVGTFDGLYLVPLKLMEKGAELMTVVQHQRIVAAKDAEIARLREERDSQQRTCIRAMEERYDLRAQLAAQQAAVPDKELKRKADLFDLYASEAEKLGYGGIGEVIDALIAKAAVPVGICDSMMLSGEVCKLPAGHDGPCGYYAAPAAPQQVCPCQFGTCLEPGADGCKAVSNAAPQQSVVMPERRPDDYPSPRTRDAWNDCLDEFARLNADRSAQGGE